MVKFQFNQDFSTSKAGDVKVMDKPFALNLVARGLGEILEGEPKQFTPPSDKSEKIVKHRTRKAK